MKIDYTLEIGQGAGVVSWCITQCPFYGLGNVGSLGCHKCRYFIADDEVNRIVTCGKEIEE